MSIAPTPRRGDVWLVSFDPTVGAEIRKVRPAVVVTAAGVGRLPFQIVVPLTDWKPHYVNASWFVAPPATAANGLSKDSGADAFQVKSVSENRFVNAWVKRRIDNSMTSPRPSPFVSAPVIDTVGCTFEDGWDVQDIRPNREVASVPSRHNLLHHSPRYVGQPAPHSVLRPARPLLYSRRDWRFARRRGARDPSSLT